MNKAICKHCKNEFEIITYTGEARFPNHRLHGSLIACDGTGELVTVASENYDGPTEFAESGPITGRRESNVGTRIERSKHPPPAKSRPAAQPSFYDREALNDRDEIDDDRILF